MGFSPGIIASARTSLSEFSYNAEALALFNAASTAPSSRRKYSVHKCIKRLKDAGIWDKITLLYLLAANDEQFSRLNWKNPGTYTLSTVGSPTFTQNDGWQTASSSNYLSTGYTPASSTDLSVGAVSLRTNASNNSIAGALNGTNGLTVNPAGTSIVVRMNSEALTFTASGVFDGSGLIFASRSGSSVSAYRNGALIGTTTASNTVAPTVPLYLLKVNGSTAVPVQRLSCFFLGTNLTASEAEQLYAILYTYLDEVFYGEALVNEAGLAPELVDADVVVYGATSSGVTAAYEAKRQGRSVVLVGGWRDRHLGGMMAGGLGFSDIDNTSACGGLARYVITQINSLYGRADSTLTFQPRYAEYVFRRLLDPSKTGGLDIPVYWSDGVASVTKNGAKIAALTTADGRVFTGKVFIDASYEGDLLAEAGVSYTVGREAAGSGKEALNGNRSTLTTSSSGGHQFTLSGTNYNVSPHVVEGDSTSGLLTGIEAYDSAAAGTADSRVQSYNFRMTLTFSAGRLVAFPSTAPSDWDLTRHEPLLRFLAALTAAGKVFDTHYTLHDLFIFNDILNDIRDTNAKGGHSLDWWSGADEYPNASYATRETIWENHRKHILGLWYTMQYVDDDRVPAAFRTDALAWGFDARHYLDPYPGDPLYWPYQLYVREARRMVSDIVWDGDDIAATDGTAPRSTKTVAVASYAMDSHHVRAMAVEYTPGSWRIWNEGNFEESSSGGTDNMSPIPYDIIIPKRAEATNLLVTFAVSATHVAFGAIRMELTAMQTGQSAGLAAAIAVEEGEIAVQDVDYDTLRTRLLASNTNADEVVPVLNQEN